MLMVAAWWAMAPDRSLATGQRRLATGQRRLATGRRPAGDWSAAGRRSVGGR